MAAAGAEEVDEPETGVSLGLFRDDGDGGDGVVSVRRADAHLRSHDPAGEDDLSAEEAGESTGESTVSIHRLPATKSITAFKSDAAGESHDVTKHLGMGFRGTGTAHGFEMTPAWGLVKLPPVYKTDDVAVTGRESERATGAMLDPDDARAVAVAERPPPPTRHEAADLGTVPAVVGGARRETEHVAPVTVDGLPLKRPGASPISNVGEVLSARMLGVYLAKIKFGFDLTDTEIAHVSDRALMDVKRGV